MSKVTHRRIALLGESLANPSDIPGLVCDIDLTDLSVMFSDTAGTTKATATSEIGYVLDKTGNGHHAIADSDAVRPHFEDGIASFDGTEKLTIASSTELDLPNPTYVIVARYRALSLDGFLINKDSTSPDSVSIRTNNFRFEAHCRYAGDAGTLITTNPEGSDDDVIRCHVVTKTATAFQHWIDGYLAAEDANTDTIDTTSGPLVIGGHPDVVDSGMTGEIYRVLVYDSGLSEGEILGISRWANRAYQYYSYVKEIDNLGANIDGHATVSVGNTLYLYYAINGQNEFQLATASTNDPHNWTVASTNVYSSAGRRGICAVYYGSTFYVFYDNSGTGEIFLATGSDPEALTVANGGTAILTGTGIVADPLRYARHPAVVTPEFSPDGDWHMIFDGRTASPAGTAGALGHASAPVADVTDWTITASPVLSPSAGDSWDRHDLTGTSILVASGGYELLYTGYNHLLKTDFNTDSGHSSWPHFLAKATSTDLLTWTANSSNPLGSNRLGSATNDIGALGIPDFFLDDKGREFVLYQGTNSDVSSRYLMMLKRSL